MDKQETFCQPGPERLNNLGSPSDDIRMFVCDKLTRGHPHLYMNNTGQVPRTRQSAFIETDAPGRASRRHCIAPLLFRRAGIRCIPSMSPSMADAVRPRPWRRYACLCSPAAARVRSSPCAGRTSILASMSSASPTPSPVPVQFSSRRRRFSCSERCRDGRTVPGCFPATIGMDASAPTPSTMSGNPPGQGGTGGRSPARPPTQLRLPRPGAR